MCKIGTLCHCSGNVNCKNVHYKKVPFGAFLYLNNPLFYDKIVLQEIIRKGKPMKKVMNKINFAIISMMVASPAFAAVNESALCLLMNDLRGVFNMLRTFAFIGAAFTIAGWAWGYISGGKVGDDKSGGAMGELKNKGSALLIGFILLFSVGLVLQFLVSATGAKTLGCVTNW